MVYAGGDTATPVSGEQEQTWKPGQEERLGLAACVPREWRTSFLRGHRREMGKCPEGATEQCWLDLRSSCLHSTRC